MRRPFTRGLMGTSCAFVLLMVGSSWGKGKCQDYPPGPHTWDVGEAGFDEMDTSALVGIDIDPDCLVDTIVGLSGEVIVERSGPPFASVQIPEDTGPGGHVGPDVIDTEIISLSLTGTGITLQAGTDAGMDPETATCSTRGNGLVARACGDIAETASDSSLADSFFDVYFRVELGGGNFVYNHDPLRINTTITCIPPIAEYEKGICLQLFDRPKGIADPIWIASLTTARHYTFPLSNPDLGSCTLNPEGKGAVCLENISEEACLANGGLWNATACIPTVSDWGLVVMAMLVLTAATVVIMRRRAMVRGGS